MVILSSITTACILAGAASASSILPRVVEDANTFTIAHITPLPFQDASPDVPAPHIFALTRHVGSHKASFMRSIRNGNQANGIYKHDKLKSGQTPISAKDAGLEFSADITFGEQTFQAILDTGSSDTWVAQKGFSCSNAATGKTEADSYCGFGPTFDPSISKTFQRIPHENTNVTYGDGEYLEGYLGYENVTLAGIEVRAEVGVVDQAAWYGDGTSSGLIGLSFPSITTAFPGDNATLDQVNTSIPYDPIFFKMFKQGIVAPVFSLALTRNLSADQGGVLAFGGLPHNLHYDERSVAKTPIQVLLINGQPWCTLVGCLPGKPQLQEYTITIDSFDWAPSSHPLSSSADHDNWNHSKPFQMVVDSGTTFNYVPADIADSFNAQYSPAAVWNDTQGAYIVPCNATAPHNTITIGGREFPIDARDLIVPGDGLPEGSCTTTVSSGDGLYILGDVFLKNVLAVFDLGATEMRFYERKY